MFFTEDKELRKYEYLMRGVPNFRPRGHDVVIVCGYRYIPICETREQLLIWATQNIRHPEFRMRLNNYINERRGSIMDFIDKNHKGAFEEIIGRINRDNYRLLAAVYLLSANSVLQRTARLHIRKNDITFRNIHTKYLDDEGYTLLCAAKDMLLGTRYLCISDLSDEILINNNMFALICNALAIRRFGLTAIRNGRE